MTFFESKLFKFTQSPASILKYTIQVKRFFKTLYLDIEKIAFQFGYALRSPTQSQNGISSD